MIPIYEVADIDISATAAPPPPLNFGALTGLFTHEIGDPVRYHGPFSTLSGLLAVFSGSAEIAAWGNAVFGVGESLAIREVYVGRIDGGDADIAASYAAIKAAAPPWYYTTCETRVEATILALAGQIEADTTPRIYLAQTADSAVLAGTAGHVGLDLQTAARNRTAVMYNANSDANDGEEAQHGYRDGAWASQVGHWSLDRYSPPWDFQTLSGQVPDEFNETQFANMKTANVNMYAPIQGFNDGSGGTQTIARTWPGKMASGRHIHAQCSLDWLKRRMQEAFIAFKAAEAQQGRRVGIDNDGLAAVDAIANGVVGRGYAAGHLNRNSPTIVVVPKLKDIPPASLDAGIIPFTASGTLRKSGDKFEMAWSVQT